MGVAYNSQEPIDHDDSKESIDDDNMMIDSSYFIEAVSSNQCFKFLNADKYNALCLIRKEKSLPTYIFVDTAF